MYAFLGFIPSNIVYMCALIHKSLWDGQISDSRKAGRGDLLISNKQNNIQIH